MRATDGGRAGRSRLLLFVLALLVYTPGFWWGAPYATAADRTNAWGVDDEPPLGPLAQAHDILHPKGEQNPNLGYPMMHPFMVLGAFTPYMGYLFLSGGVKNPTVAYPHGFADPVRALAVLTWIAHFLSVLLGAGVVVLAFEIGRTLWDERSGILSALSVMLMYPMWYYARNSNVDVPVLFFTAAGLASFAAIVQRGLSMRRAMVFGVLVGLAVATKEPSFASFAFAPAVLLFLPEPGTPAAPWRSASFWRTATMGAAVALGAYALGSGVLVDHRRWLAHMEFVGSRLATLKENEVAFMKYYPMTLEGHRDFAWRLVSLLTYALSWPGLVLGAAGMVAATRRTPRQAVLALSGLGYLAVLFLTARAAQLRYLMPVALILAIFAGRAVAMAWESARDGWRVAAGGLAAATALMLVCWDADLTWAMLRDSRYAAGAWIARHARPGDRLEYFGSEHKHPPMPATVLSSQAIPFRGSAFRADTGAIAIDRIVRGWRIRRPRFVVLVPDYTNPGQPYAAACPPAIFRGLEDSSLGYRPVAFFETPALLPWAHRPPLDYPVVNPPIRLYERADVSAASQ